MPSSPKIKPGLWLALAALAVFTATVECRKNFQGIEGNYCRGRQPAQCCDGRIDSCEVPILGTYCYCDTFCTEGDRENNDCCPDYFEVCLGYKTNTSGPSDLMFGTGEINQDLGCEINGVQVKSGEAVMVNCNECRCQNSKVVCDKDACMMDDHVVLSINSSPGVYGWQASTYKEFWARKAQDALMYRTGTFTPQDKSQEMYPLHLKPDISKIPVSFDARKKLEWAGRVGHVCDQGWCGSSWAFSTLGVTQDRLAIMSRGYKLVKLSAQNLLSCAKLGQDGCNGGYIDRAWNYVRLHGIVREECYKYESGKTSSVPKCIIRRKDLSALTCQSKDRYRMEPAYRISGREEEIQWEIMHNGPVQALMTVHTDLFMYKSGVYSYSGVSPKGHLNATSATHSVRIIGWGSSRMLGSAPIKYWLVANSWGAEWGENGYFRIKRGSNECGIESFVIASRAKMANFMYGNRRHT